mgnify:FL=1
MDRRTSQASDRGTQPKLRHQERTPFVTVLAFGSVLFALVAGGSLLVMSQGTVDDVAEVPSVAAQDWTQDVSRSDGSMLDASPANTAQTPKAARWM